ncbi:MAG: hypothetical protein BV458_07360 [Thermoplasmata archaeon M9B2D]|nr:MAG: hypothetical protein BV458_07360 [Thermoplasmata archaeon M9B2D]
MKRKIPYEAWSRECAKFSKTRTVKSSKTIVTPQDNPVTPQDSRGRHNQTSGGGEKMAEAISGRKHTLNVILPKKVSAHTDSELKLMLVTLKNAMVASSVHISRIEKELKERGVDPRILSVPRLDSVSDFDENLGDAE